MSSPANEIERVEVLVQDLHARDAHRLLPDNVFLVKIGVTMQRTQGKDKVMNVDDSPLRPPTFPVTVRRSESLPYISSTVVYFENPAEISSRGKVNWTYEGFVEQMNNLIKMVEAADPTSSERFYLNHVTLVEVPKEYAIKEDDGKRAVDKSLFEDRAEMALGYFTKRPSISNEEIKEKLGDSLPNKIRQPLRLTKIKEVNAKEYRGTNETSAMSTKRRYFTEGQAEQYNDLSLTPSVWMLTEDATESDEGDFRPLRVALDDIDRFFPELSESPFMQKVKFYGKMDSTERFVEEDAVVLGP